MATIQTLSQQEAAAHGFTHVAKVTYADLAAYVDDLVGEVALHTPTDTVLIGPCAMRVVTAFDGATTVTCELGDTGDTARHMDPVDMKAAAETVYGVPAATAPAGVGGTGVFQATFTTTSEYCDDLTAGEVHIFFKVANLEQLGT
jgi:hypothetical protein